MPTAATLETFLADAESITSSTTTMPRQRNDIGSGGPDVWGSPPPSLQLFGA